MAKMSRARAYINAMYNNKIFTAARAAANAILAGLEGYKLCNRLGRRVGENFFFYFSHVYIECV